MGRNVQINNELYNELHNLSRKLNTDVTKLVRTSIQLYLHGLQDNDLYNVKDVDYEKE